MHGSICEIVSGLGSEDAMVCELLTCGAQQEATVRAALSHGNSQMSPRRPNVGALEKIGHGSYWLRTAFLSRNPRTDITHELR